MIAKLVINEIQNMKGRQNNIKIFLNYTVLYQGLEYEIFFHRFYHKTRYKHVGWSYATYTHCSLVLTEKLMANSECIKHNSDKDNPIIGMQKSLAKLTKKLGNKELNTLIWKEFNKTIAKRYCFDEKKL